MRLSTATLFITAFLIADQNQTNAETDTVSVNQYGGPTECEEDDKALSGKHLEIHFNGTIDESSATGEKGFLFHSTHLSDSGRPFPFRIGTGDVIEGWDEGLDGLCRGAKVVLVIPPGKAFGDDGFETDQLGGSNNKKVPAGATLKYDIEILEVSDKNPSIDLFGVIDTNGDKRLDKAEVDSYFSGIEMKVAPEELWETEDKDKDGFISWDEFSGPKGKKTEDHIFESLDTNTDGKLDREELIATGDVSGETWEKADTDGDGFLSREEFVHEFSGEEHVRIEKRPEGQTKESYEEKIFDQLDTNGDGKLSKEEYTAGTSDVPGEAWEKDDTDGDGFLSREEFVQQFSGQTKPVTIGDDMGEGTEGQTKKTDEEKTQDLIFESLDTNSDGKLSREEFTAGTGDVPEDMWEKEDADGDGFLSREEFVRQFSGQSKPVKIGADMGEL